MNKELEKIVLDLNDERLYPRNNCFGSLLRIKTIIDKNPNWNEIGKKLYIPEYTRDNYEKLFSDINLFCNPKVILTPRFGDIVVQRNDEKNWTHYSLVCGGGVLLDSYGFYYEENWMFKTNHFIKI